MIRHASNKLSGVAFAAALLVIALSGVEAGGRAGANAYSKLEEPPKPKRGLAGQYKDNVEELHRNLGGAEVEQQPDGKRWPVEDTPPKKHQREVLQLDYNLGGTKYLNYKSPAVQNDEVVGRLSSSECVSVADHSKPFRTVLHIRDFMPYFDCEQKECGKSPYCTGFLTLRPHVDRRHVDPRYMDRIACPCEAKVEEELPALRTEFEKRLERPEPIERTPRTFRQRAGRFFNKLAYPFRRAGTGIKRTLGGRGKAMCAVPPQGLYFKRNVEVPCMSDCEVSAKPEVQAMFGETPTCEWLAGNHEGVDACGVCRHQLSRDRERDQMRYNKVRKVWDQEKDMAGRDNLHSFRRHQADVRRQQALYGGLTKKQILKLRKEELKAERQRYGWEQEKRDEFHPVPTKGQENEPQSTGAGIMGGFKQFLKR